MSKKKRKENLGPSPILLWIFVIVLIAVMFFLINSSLFNVTDIEVEGNSAFTDEAVIGLSGIDYDTNIIHVDEDAAKEGIESNPFLKVENIVRKFPTKVVITVTERAAVGQIGTVNGYYFIDKEGTLLALSEVKSDYVVDITGMSIRQSEFGQTILTDSDDKLRGLTRVLEAYEEYSLQGKITGINLYDPRKIRITYQNEITVEIGDGINAMDRLRYIETVIETVRDRIGEGQILYLNSDDGYYIG